MSEEPSALSEVPAVWVIRNDFCECRAIYGNPECWRAICQECGNYLAFHMATAEVAQGQADRLIATGHRCGRFHRDDAVHGAAIQNARVRSFR